MKFDPTKPVQTRDGRKARIICVTSEKSLYPNKLYPIVALVACGNRETIKTYTSDGEETYGVASIDNLINIPIGEVKAL